MSLLDGAANVLRLSGLSDAETSAVGALADRLSEHAFTNFRANAYYEARHVLEHPGVTIPAEVSSRISHVVGAPSTVVDVLDERLEFRGWDSDSELGLSEAYEANELDAEAPMVHLDALVFGTAFARVGTRPGAGPLITMHSPLATTGERDPVTRRLSASWTSLKVKDGVTVLGVLDLPDESVTVERDRAGWHVVDRDEHGLGRVPVVQFANRPRTARRGGKSEITSAIRSLTENMMRATLGMTVNSQFYSIPQMMILGRGPDAFKDRSGNPIPGWRILAGHALAIDKDADGDTPDMKQMSVASPAPFIEQLREFRMQIAAEAGMPADYLGIQTSNPSSADAIRAGESRLVKRAERRQSGFGRSWMEVARLAVLMRDGQLPEDFDQRVFPEWRSAATPTAAATADEVTKLVAAGILTPDSAIVRKRLGLTRAEDRILADEQARAATATTGAQLLADALSRQQAPTGVG